MNKTSRIMYLAGKRTEPFTISELRSSIGVKTSLSTVYTALAKLPIKWVNQPQGKHFYRVYFPVGTSDDDIRAWLNERMKTGKSKAKICGHKDKVSE